MVEQGLGKRVLAKADEDPKAPARRWQSSAGCRIAQALLGSGLSERTQSVLAQAAPPHRLPCCWAALIS